MRSKAIIGLILLNVVLLTTLCFSGMFSQSARAQVARPSEYIQISGEVQGGTSGVVFTVDTRNGLLTATTFDGKKMEFMPPLDLKRVFK